ncbi:MAG TPA: hypothetical protein PKZ69_01760 [Candidatus Cloacimonadota bacterium]|nr:hypothetical protein [Candidatus Cloacimonadota bacterium]
MRKPKKIGIKMKDISNDLITVMNDRRVWFDRTIAKAEAYFTKKRYELAAVYLEIAATYASFYHLGLFVSDRIESMAAEISSLCINKESKGVPKDKVERVLHVISMVFYPYGGHSKLMQNWISYDKAGRSDIILTEQKQGKVPDIAFDFYYERGSKVIFLKDRDEDILTRAQRLYDLSVDYDVVVFHINPSDIIPLIAFSGTDKSVIFMNQADHRFWVGRNASNIVVNFRKIGNDLSIKRRMISEDNLFLLPIPLARVLKISKKEARNRLNIDEKSIMIFSVASSYKYNPNGDDGIHRILLPIVEKHRNVKVIVVGPDISEPYWNDVYNQTDGRVEAVGLKGDIEWYYAAADLYLDSYPVGSITSLLDAGKYKLPIFTLIKNKSLMDVDEISLESIDFSSSSFDEIIGKLSYYISHEKERVELGEECYKMISKYHMGENWISSLEQLYQKALSKEKIKETDSDGSNSNYDKNDASLVFLYAKGRTRKHEYYSCAKKLKRALPFWDNLRNNLCIIISAFNNRDILYLIMPHTIDFVKKQKAHYFAKVKRGITPL